MRRRQPRGAHLGAARRGHRQEVWQIGRAGLAQVAGTCNPRPQPAARRRTERPPRAPSPFPAQVQQNIPVIPKSQDPKYQAQDLDLFGWELSKEDFDALTAAVTPPVTGGGDGKTSGVSACDSNRGGSLENRAPRTRLAMPLQTRVAPCAGLQGPLSLRAPAPAASRARSRTLFHGLFTYCRYWSTLSED